MVGQSLFGRVVFQLSTQRFPLTFNGPVLMISSMRHHDALQSVTMTHWMCTGDALGMRDDRFRKAPCSSCGCETYRIAYIGNVLVCPKCFKAFVEGLSVK